MHLKAMELDQPDSVRWARATAAAFNKLRLPECADEPKPDWWHDEALKQLSARVVAAAPDGLTARLMRAAVLSGVHPAWEAGPRTAKELKEAAAHFERVATLHPAPAVKARFADCAAWCRRRAEAM